jgi:hypothetical protein
MVFCRAATGRNISKSENAVLILRDAGVLTVQTLGVEVAPEQWTFSGDRFRIEYDCADPNSLTIWTRDQHEKKVLVVIWRGDGGSVVGHRVVTGVEGVGERLRMITTPSKREQREARRAARSARNAEIDRIERNAAGRERRATPKAKAARERELSKLIGALGMLGSEHAGERAAAALQVERLHTRLGKQWKDFIL